MQLYTVEIGRKIMSSSFDANGNLLISETTFETVRLCDLPHSTAAAYKLRFPDNPVKIVTQEEFTGEMGRHDLREHGTRRDRTEKSAAAPSSNNDDAALRGDIAAAINARS